jgi:hypothetical protein
MSILKNYVNYLKDNPKGYWFKRKLYGWGWTPATKEGWSLLALYFFSILYIGFTENNVSTLLIEFSIITALFLFIVYLKGEPPKWQWGLKNEKKD